LALLFVDRIGVAAATTIDAAFLIVFATVILREIIAGRNWRNLKTVALVSALAAANIGFHLFVAAYGAILVQSRQGSSGP
jgi:uncharacterized protein involved in response to NO